MSRIHWVTGGTGTPYDRSPTQTLAQLRLEYIYVDVSVMKVEKVKQWILVSRIHWVPWGTGTPCISYLI